MQDSDFIKMISRSGRKMGIIGFFILAFGGFMVWLFVSGADSEAEKMSTGGKITGMVFAGIFIVVGLLMLVISINTSLKIKGGKHPLVNAIQSNDPGFILWYYEHITHVKSGPARNTAHNIWLMSNTKKQYTISIKKGKVEEMFAYLATKFPTALVGYSKELESAYEQKLKDLKG